MGANLLENVSKVNLIAQDAPVAAIAPRFCERNGLTLKEKPISGLFTRGRSFVNASSDALRFDVKKKLFGGIVLLDPTKSVVCNFQTKTFSTSPLYHVCAGKKSDDRHKLFDIAAAFDFGNGSGVEVEFKDVTSGEKCKLSFEGNWRDREALFWLRKGRSERLEAVAKVYCPEGKTSFDYEIEIAPNMDTALIVIVASLLADAQDVVEDQMTGQLGGYESVF